MRADFLAVADHFGIGSSPKVLKLVNEAVAVWPEFARAAKLSEAETRSAAILAVFADWKHALPQIFQEPQ